MTPSLHVSESEPAYFCILYVQKGFPLFTRAGYFHIVVDVLNDLVQYDSLEIVGYVIMPEFVQLLYKCNIGDPEKLMKHFSCRSSLRLFDYIHNNDDSRRRWLKEFFVSDTTMENETPSIWSEIHFEEVRSLRVAESILHDLLHLPVREGIVSAHEYYTNSSANYLNNVVSKGGRESIISDRPIIH